MSKNLDTLRTGYKNFDKGDIPAVLETFDPKIKWTEPEGFPYAGTYVGPEAVRDNVFMKLGDEWESFQVETNEFIENGDRVVVLGEYHGKSKATGKKCDVGFAHIWTVHDGIAQKFNEFAETAKAQQAMQK